MRKSTMLLNEVYFWTDTIKNWNNLLYDDNFKLIIINQLQWLINHQKINLYGFVIMPNHIHLLWEMKDMNGKEKPYASFNKWTSSQFLKRIRSAMVCRGNAMVCRGTDHGQTTNISKFIERTTERNHRFWIRDPLAVLMNSKAKFEQKLNYIHLNPLQPKWNLVKQPEHYKWSSAKFYECGIDEFGILTHYMDRF